RYTVARHTYAIRCYYQIPSGENKMENTPEGVRLRQRALWTALAVKQGGVLFSRVEIRRIDDPRQQVLPVSRFGDACLDFAFGNAGIALIVYGGDFSKLTGVQIKAVQFGSPVHIGERHDQLVVQIGRAHV